MFTCSLISSNNILFIKLTLWASPVVIVAPADAVDTRNTGLSWVRKMPWRRAWQPTPVFLPRESHGQSSLAGYSPRGCKELDTTEATEHT